MNIKTWQEEAKEWPNHRRGLATNQMIWMQQEIDELRAAYEALQKENAELKHINLTSLADLHFKNRDLEDRNAAQAKRIEAIETLCTHDYESKDDFILRVKEILKDENTK